jgi:glutamine amidotransferase
MDGIADGTRFYFVHSFAPPPGDHTVATTDYGSTAFSAVVARENVFATQFHPEKSGDAGLHIYDRFVRSLA